MNNFNVLYPMQSEIVREKSKQTNLARYGFENSGQVPQNKEKCKQTNLARYGFESASSSPLVKEKRKETINNLMNRPVVIKIKKYRDKFELKLGVGWLYKKQETLDNILEELKATYGELE